MVNTALVSKWTTLRASMLLAWDTYSVRTVDGSESDVSATKSQFSSVLSVRHHHHTCQSLERYSS